MNYTDVEQSAKYVQPMKSRKAYVVPALKDLTAEEARGVLLQHADSRNPKALHLLQCIEELERKNGS